jgi:glycosyltransferase involved in cell wall biosynthesis
MKILVATTTFPRWKDDTVPPFVYHLCQHLVLEGHKIIVLAPHHSKAKLKENFDGMTIYRFPYFWPDSFQKLCYGSGIITNIKKSFLAKMQIPFLLLIEFLYLLYLVKKEKPNVIHAHWLIPQGLLAGTVKKMFKIPLVITGHGTDVFFFQKGLLRKLARVSISSCDIFTVNSSATYKAAQNLLQTSKVKLIPMGVEIQKFNPNMRDKTLRERLQIKGPFLLFIGRLVTQKGAGYVINAQAEIIKKYPEAKLVIIGDGQERSVLEEEAKELKIESSVLFLGRQPNSELPKYFATADIFIGHSLTLDTGETEAFGVVFLEALASGTPVITTAAGGITDIITDNQTGLIVEERSSRGIASAVERILSDPQMAQSLTHNGRKLAVEKYAWPKVAKEFSAFFECLR